MPAKTSIGKASGNRFTVILSDEAMDYISRNIPKGQRSQFTDKIFLELLEEEKRNKDAQEFEDFIDSIEPKKPIVPSLQAIRQFRDRDVSHEV